MPENEPQKNPEQQGDGNGPGPGPMKFNRTVVFWIVAGIALLAMLTVAYDYNAKSATISADTFWTYVQNGYVEKIVVRKTQINGELRKIDIPGLDADAPREFTLEYDYQADRDFFTKIAASPHRITWRNDLGDGLLQLLPMLLYVGVLILLIWFVVIRQFRGAGPGGGILGNFGRSRHRISRKEHTHTTFDDVAGIQEAKDEVGEVIEFLKNPKQFQRLGARIPRGILLVGAPGCGKTLLAKAIAGEADVPFFSISGSDFVEMFVGVGASRVRDLFKQAKDNAPCIIFLDEIDAVGRKRGMGFGGGHDEREQTLNAILVEMDGFDTTDQVIVIAATNRVDVLDPALTRPGRFDREIHVPLPDIQGRVDILKIYAAKVACGPDVDLQRLARGTPMFSGADLSALVNEAAIAATMAGKDSIEMADMEEARDKVRWGRARKSHVVDEREKRMTAYHEAGHALVQLLTEEADPLHKVSIIPRGQAGGATFSLPENDRHMYTRRWCLAYIRVTMAGRIAEQMFFNDVDSGASGDIHQATELARRMVMDWGMSERLGFVRYRSPSSDGMGELMGKDYSDQTAQVIDTEIQQMMAECEAGTRQLIESHRDAVDRVAQALLKYETLGADEVQMVVDGKTLDRPTVGDLLANEHAKFHGNNNDEANADEAKTDQEEAGQGDTNEGATEEGEAEDGKVDQTAG